MKWRKKDGAIEWKKELNTNDQIHENLHKR